MRVTETTGLGIHRDTAVAQTLDLIRDEAQQKDDREPFRRRMIFEEQSVNLRGGWETGSYTADQAKNWRIDSVDEHRMDVPALEAAGEGVPGLNSSRMVVAGYQHIHPGSLIDTRPGYTRDEQSRCTANSSSQYTLEGCILWVLVAECAASRIAAGCTQIEWETQMKALGTDVDNPTTLNRETMLDWVAIVASCLQRTVIVSNPNCPVRC